MAQSTRRQYRRGTLSIWPITILLVLSHGVWNTSQCSTSPSSRTRPVVINISREDPSPSSEDYGEETRDEPAFEQGYMEGGTGEQPPDHFPRPSRSDNDNNENKYHFCQKRLTSELNTVCAGKFHVPKSPFRQAGKRSLGNGVGRQVVLYRRVPRSLVDECCTEPCDPSFMEKYCLNGNGSASNSNVSNENKERLPEEKEGEDTKPSIQHNTSGEPESALYYPLLHLLKFLHGRLGTPKQPSPSESGGEEEERALPPLHQAYVQDKHSAHAFPSQHSHRREFHSNSHYTSKIGGGGYRGSGFNPAYASHVRPSSSISASNFESRKNHVSYPYPGFQEHGQARSDEKPIQNGTWKNTVTSTLPPLMFPIGVGTDANSYPLHIISQDSKEAS